MTKETFDVSWKRKCVKYSFVCGNFFFVFSSLMFTIFLFSYTIHSNVCDGVDITNTTCVGQIEAEGYKSTQSLVENHLLPRNWTKVHTDAQGNETYHLCEWNSKIEKCVAAEPEAPGCESELNDDGVRTQYWGKDGECEALKAPEICKKTGFNDANLKATQEKIATLGYTAFWAGIILLITFILSVISTINMYWDFVTSITCGLCGLAPDGGSVKNFCIEYGRPFACFESCPSFGLICNCCQSIDNCKPFCKKNNVNTGGYSKPYEAGTIVLSFLTHSVLIIYFGSDALTARNEIEKHCYGASGAPYATDALDFVETLTDKDALNYYNSRQAIDVLMVIGYWGVLITTAMELVSYFLANGESEDMECFALRSSNEGGACGDLNPCHDISVGSYSALSTSENEKDRFGRVPKREMYSTRTVQLRGQF